jgi:hypothetical protein
MSVYDKSRFPTSIIPIEHRDVIAWNSPSSPACPDVDSIRAIVRDFIDGSISGITFRSYFRSKGVPLSSELEQLIRNHEADNSGNFSNFIVALIRSGSWDEVDTSASVMTFDAQEMINSRNLNKGRKNLNSVPDILSWSCDICLEFVL